MDGAASPFQVYQHQTLLNASCSQCDFKPAVFVSWEGDQSPSPSALAIVSMVIPTEARPLHPALWTVLPKWHGLSPRALSLSWLFQNHKHRLSSTVLAYHALDFFIVRPGFCWVEATTLCSFLIVKSRASQEGIESCLFCPSSVAVIETVLVSYG